MSTYCISDIHGHWENFEAFLNDIDEDDRVFLLGDVVDKGNDPIRVLQHVMKDKRFTMLLGNHEHMMYCYLKSHSSEDYIQWMLLNHGNDTYLPFMELSAQQQKEIFEYIENLPLCIPDLQVNGRHFYLVHAMPYGDKHVKMNDVDFDFEIIAQFVWSRYEGQDMPQGVTVIAGHTPVVYYRRHHEPFGNNGELADSNFIDIDGGLAMSNGESVLIALKLDDLSYRIY